MNGPTTSRIARRRRLEGPVVPGPVVGRGGVVYAASNGGVLHAVRARDGRELWRFDGGSPYGSDLSFSPAIGGVVDSYPALAGDGTLLIGSDSGALYAIRD